MLPKAMWTRVALLALASWTVWPGCDGEPGVPPGQVAPDASGLAAYKLTLGPKSVDGVWGNASGLAFNPGTRTLFLVVNSPPTVVELELDGTTKRRVALTGFQDTEGIAHVRDNTFAIAEEGRGALVLVRITPGTESVDYAACTKIMIDPAGGDNTGLEGVAYHAGKGRFFGVKEKKPRKIYELAQATDKEPNPQVKHPWDVEEKHLGMSDLSGIHYDGDSGHLLILSDESRCVVECTTDGTEVSRLSLADGKSGLQAGPPQPEGITMDDEGNLYICSEPNLFYVFASEEE